MFKPRPFALSASTHKVFSLAALSFLAALHGAAGAPAALYQEVRGLRIAGETVIDTAEMIGQPVFSRDGRRLYYGRSNGPKSEIVIRDIASGKALATFTTPKMAVNLAISPDGARLLFCVWGNGAFMLDTAARHVTDLDMAVRDCSGAHLYWTDDIHITVMIGHPTFVLDLDTLQSKQLYLKDGWAPTKTDAEIEEVAREAYRSYYGITPGSWDFREDKYHLYLYAASDDDQYWRKILDLGQSHSISPDRRFVLTTWGCNIANPCTMRRTEIKASGPLQPIELAFEAPEDVAARLDEHLGKGRSVGARLFAPRLNPLNGKTIGPASTSHTDAMGWGSVTKNGNRYVIRVRLEEKPLSSADVVYQFWWSDEKSSEDIDGIGWLPLKEAIEPGTQGQTTP